jgi:hypothetical protein
MKDLSDMKDLIEDHDVEDPTINGKVCIHEIQQAMQESSCRLYGISFRESDDICSNESSQRKKVFIYSL